MIVFKYLYDMMDVFGPLMDKWANGEKRHVGNEDDDQVREWEFLMVKSQAIYKLKTGITTTIMWETTPMINCPPPHQ
jgi:hypothetical protein